MNKKINLIILVVMMLLLGDSLMERKRIFDSLDISFRKDTIEYGEQFNIDSIVEKYNGELSVEGEPDTDKIGDYEVKYILSEISRYGNRIDKTVTQTIHVTDSKPPVIEFKEDKISVYKGNGYDLKENIGRVYDEVDGDIKDYKVESDVNFDEAGEYEVKATAVDSNGLSTEKTYSLNVRNRIVSTAEGFDIIYDQLTSVYGYNRAAACGILANLWFECNFNPDVGDYYYGLCQWGGSRKDNLYSYCADNGLDASTIEGQLAFMNYELSNGYAGVKSYLLSVADNSDGAYDAAVYFCDRYEGAASNSGRGELARDYYG
jgi:PKD repeat protein